MQNLNIQTHIQTIKHKYICKQMRNAQFWIDLGFFKYIFDVKDILK